MVSLRLVTHCAAAHLTKQRTSWNTADMVKMVVFAHGGGLAAIVGSYDYGVCIRSILESVSLNSYKILAPCISLCIQLYQYDTGSKYFWKTSNLRFCLALMVIFVSSNKSMWKGRLHSSGKKVPTEKECHVIISESIYSTNFAVFISHCGQSR